MHLIRKKSSILSQIDEPDKMHGLLESMAYKGKIS